MQSDEYNSEFSVKTDNVVRNKGVKQGVDVELDLYADVESAEFDEQGVNKTARTQQENDKYVSEETSADENDTGNKLVDEKLVDNQQQEENHLDQEEEVLDQVDLNINDDGVLMTADETGLYDDVMAAPTPSMSADDLANAQVPDLKMDMLSQSASSISQPLLSAHSISNSSNISNSSYTKRVSCYVGNLTWWTTDKDLFDAITALSITDIIEIKFYENKINGQSKGFASVTVGSDQSFRTIMDKLPKSQLNGQEPIVTNYNRHYLNQFEEQARKDMPNSGQAANHPQANNSTGLLNSGQPQFEHQNMNRNRNYNPNIGQNAANGLPLTRPNMMPMMPRPQLGSNPNAPGLVGSFPVQQQSQPIRAQSSIMGMPHSGTGNAMKANGAPNSFPYNKSINNHGNSIMGSRPPLVPNNNHSANSMMPMRPGMVPNQSNNNSNNNPNSYMNHRMPQPGQPNGGQMPMNHQREWDRMHNFNNANTMMGQNNPMMMGNQRPPLPPNQQQFKYPNAQNGMIPSPSVMGGPGSQTMTPNGAAFQSNSFHTNQMHQPGQAPIVPPTQPGGMMNPQYGMAPQHGLIPPQPPVHNMQDPYNHHHPNPQLLGANPYAAPAHMMHHIGQAAPMGMNPYNMNEMEYQEAIEKNRTIYNTAITRAYKDASNGQYSSAIETLSDAIALINQSRIGNDPNCKSFISSLQDNKKSFEEKYYESGGSSGGRHRSSTNRADSRDRERKRSRSRDSRDRDRGGKDRERERDRGSRRGDKHHKSSHRDRSRDRRNENLTSNGNDYYDDHSSSRSSYNRNRH